MIVKFGSINILKTKGDESKIKIRLKYEAHIWVHDGVIKKNLTEYTESEILDQLDTMIKFGL